MRPLDLLQRAASEHVTESARMEVRPEASSVMNFLMSQGLGEATNVLVIDEGLCVGCDNCEKACAETHNGISRLDRKAGASFAQVHIPISCRHCEQPHCMKDCPPNAIKRSPTARSSSTTPASVAATASQLPYGLIRMAYEAPKKPGLLSWLMFGKGPGVGEEHDYHPSDAAKAKGKKSDQVATPAAPSATGLPVSRRVQPGGACVSVRAQYLDLADQQRR